MTLAASQPPPVKVVFLNEGRRAAVAAGRTVLDVALELAVTISHVCGGEGTCSTCRVLAVVNPENLSPIEPNEIAYDMGDGVRLGCQARILGDVGLRVIRTQPAVSASPAFPGTAAASRV